MVKGQYNLIKLEMIENNWTNCKIEVKKYGNVYVAKWRQIMQTQEKMHFPDEKPNPKNISDGETNSAVIKR